MSGAAERYWTEFVQLKRNSIYLSRYSQETHDIDWSIDVANAVASSSSIGAWVIWRDLSLLWGLIIAMSQVLAVLKEYLPHKRRLKALYAIMPEVDALAISAEQDWVRIQGGKLTEDEINEAYFNLKRTFMKIQNAHFSNSVLPVNEKLAIQADLTTKRYFEEFYGVTEEVDGQQQHQ